MVIWSYITGPLIGGVIGYITNWLAIKMLFRPYSAKYIFGVKIPFTPGIIPKEKGNIAASLGGAISENLMGKDILEKNLLSEDMISKIKGALDKFFETQKSNSETLREFLSHYLTRDDVDKLIHSIKESVTSQIGVKLADSDLGEGIANVVVERVTAKIRLEGLDINLPDIVKRALGLSLWGKIADLIAPPAKYFLEKGINKMLEDNGEEIAKNIISNGINELASTPMSSLLSGKDSQLLQLEQSCISLYQTVISDYLPNILKAVNIPAVIESRVNEMDMHEVETLVFELMDKELKAILWLGALLGMVLGCINVFI